jgi:hypothetical protein
MVKKVRLARQQLSMPQVARGNIFNLKTPKLR